MQWFPLHKCCCREVCKKLVMFFAITKLLHQNFFLKICAVFRNHQSAGKRVFMFSPQIQGSTFGFTTEPSRLCFLGRYVAGLLGGHKTRLVLVWRKAAEKPPRLNVRDSVLYCHALPKGLQRNFVAPTQFHSGMWVPVITCCGFGYCVVQLGDEKHLTLKALHRHEPSNKCSSERVGWEAGWRVNQNTAP